MTSLRQSFLRYVAQTAPQPDGFEVKCGDGIYLYDHSDRAYFDCISGIAVSSFGHRHPVIQQAIREQLDLHLHTMVYGEHVQVPQVKLAEQLAALLPPTLNSTYFTNSGAEAVEGALKLARRYTGRFEIVACRNAYHGSTAGAESLRSDAVHVNAMRPLVPGIRHIRFNEEADLEIITERTAAVIVEPIQGEAGVLMPSVGYLSKIHHRCREVGALMIADEIQCGMGRTGTYCTFEQEDFVPDILLLAKAFGGGMPLGAFIADKTIMDTLSNDPPLSHLTTFGGHPLSCAAALAALHLVNGDNFLANVTERGEQIKSSLRDHDAITEIRGRGLMLAIELKDPSMVIKAVASCREQGLLIDWFLFNDRCLRLYPPLIISEVEVGEMCERIRGAL
jgi:acetylornithine/N-succinyldiaminopimelate aminotransferase